MGKVNLTITLIIEPLVKSICPNRFFILSVKDGFCEYVSLIFISFCFSIFVSSFQRILHYVVSTDIALYLYCISLSSVLKKIGSCNLCISEAKKLGCVLRKTEAQKSEYVLYVRVRLCVHTRERKATKNTIDKNGFLSVISDKKYPSCIRLKFFNEKAK